MSVIRMCGVRTLALLVCCLVFSGSAWSDESSLNETINLSGSDLSLQGEGVRSRMFIDLYIGRLYLEKALSDPSEIVNDRSAMAIGLTVESSLITSDKLKEATREGFEKSIGDTSEMDVRIEQMLSAFNAPVSVGDQFYLSWEPDAGVIEVRRNQQILKRIKGLDFKQALFGIWLGDDPVQDSLKEDMLGL